MRLSVLLQALGLPCAAEHDREIGAITEDSRKADARTLFVCIKGQRFDGHAYAEAAYAAGCRAFVAEAPIVLPADASVWQVADSRLALGLLADAIYGSPSQKIHLIGITGTKGKTTVACLLQQILAHSGISCGYIGTNGIQYASVHTATKNTTPDAVTFQGTLKEMADAGCQAAVVEVSSQALKQHRVAGTSFDTCLFTNLSNDHIGKGEHADMQEYIACKHRLFTDFRASTAIVNDDDEMSGEMLAGTTAARVITCSMRQAADYTAEDILYLREQDGLGIACTVAQGDERTDVRLPMIGKINIGNALLAISAAHCCFGVSLRAAAEALCEVQIAGRSEVIALPSGALAVIDYAHNGESLRQILTELRAYKPSRLICLFGSVGERSRMRRRALGEAAAELADLCILTADNPGREPPEQIMAEIAACFTGKRGQYICISDRAEAIRRGVEMASAGDIFLLAGKGHENYQLIQQEKLPFSERELLLAATYR